MIVEKRVPRRRARRGIRPLYYRLKLFYQWTMDQSRSQLAHRLPRRCTKSARSGLAAKERAVVSSSNLEPWASWVSDWSLNPELAGHKLQSLTGEDSPTPSNHQSCGFDAGRDFAMWTMTYTGDTRLGGPERSNGIFEWIKFGSNRKSRRITLIITVIPS